jgi:hypothetical protein
MPHLIACPSCSRHVRASEASCPFCKASVVEAAKAFVPRKRPTERLGRAALYALGIGSASLTAACSSSSTPVVTSDGGEHDVAPQPFYGAASDAAFPIGDAGRGDADDDAPSPIDDAAQPFYGAASDAAFPIGDADDDAPHGEPVYGAPADAAFPIHDAGSPSDGSH